MQINRSIFSLFTLFTIFLLVGINTGQSKFMQAIAGGEFVFNEQNLPCLTDDQREEITRLNDESIIRLKKLGKLTDNPNKASSSSFGFPIKAADAVTDNGVYGISNFIDQDPNFPDQLLDYMGGTRTYDLSSGYNHKGTDIFTWPFGWYKMDNDEVEIISVADGVIINKFDGNFDRNCGLGSGNWNAVYVRHTNDEVVWYGHMKKNSLTSKNVGDSVSAGEFLGIVGSSGSSTGPHLHLEVYDNLNQLIDPWLGPSNPTITTSWWDDQKPYYDSKVNKISTNSTWPVFPNCPETESLNIKNEFNPGDTIYVVAFYQDQLKNQNSSYSFTTPENITWQQWNHSMTADHYAASWWGWWWILPSNASLGNWKFSVAYEGNIYNHDFVITDNPTGIDDDNIVNDFSLDQNYPNPFNPSTTINFTISEPGFTSLKVYDVLGKEVANLISEEMSAGTHQVIFDAEDQASGIYIYRVTSNDFSSSKRMMLLK